MMQSRLPAIIGTLLLALASHVPAQAADAPPPTPYQINLLYTGEIWDNLAGGQRRGSLYMQNADVQLRVDTDRAFGWTGGRAWLEGFYQSRNSFSTHYVGAAEEVSPIDSAGYELFRLYQACYDQNLGNTDILFGIYDLETEFSTTRPMALFLSKNLTWNTALDQSGTAALGGSIGPGNYPCTPLALRVRQQFGHDWSVQAVIADAAADNPVHQASNGIYFSNKYGILGMVELDYQPDGRSKLMLGGWGLTSKLPTNARTNANGTPRTTYGEAGFYIGGATRLYRQGNRQGLDGFLTLGAATPDSTDISLSSNGGLVYTGLFDARPFDKLGISFATNTNPGSYRNAQLAEGSRVFSTETNFELTYRAQLNDWLTVQPDLQYIIHPGYAPGLKNDLLIGRHFEIGHLFDL